MSKKKIVTAFLAASAIAATLTGQYQRSYEAGKQGAQALLNMKAYTERVTNREEAAPVSIMRVFTSAVMGGPANGFVQVINDINPDAGFAQNTAVALSLPAAMAAGAVGGFESAVAGVAEDPEKIVAAIDQETKERQLQGNFYAPDPMVICRDFAFGNRT